MTKAEALVQLRTILDPDLGIDIVTLGLIYDVTIKDDNAHVLMTFTTPFCPAAPYLKEQVTQALESFGAKEVSITVTFDPPWKAPETLRLMMGV